MGDVVVVTRNGRGTVYLAPSRQDADRHPLVQYGDVVALGPADVLDLWNVHELIQMGLRLLTEPAREKVEQVQEMVGGWSERRSALEPLAQAYWDALVAVAQPLPDDPKVICELVTRDRKLMENTMAEAKSAKADKTPKAKPEPKPKTHGGFRPEQKITLLKDKENKPYGADNNPKRPGTNAAKLFIKYKTGMSVGEFIAAGGTGAALQYDNKHGYIKVA